MHFWHKKWNFCPAAKELRNFMRFFYLTGMMQLKNLNQLSDQSSINIKINHSML